MPSKTKFCTVGEEPFTSLAIAKSKFVGELNRIAVDKYCYIYLKKALDNQEIVTIAVDYPNKDGVFQFIDTSIFRFATVNQLPLFFSRIEVKEDGSREIYFLEKNCTSSADDDCKEFLNFLNEGKKFKRVLTVKKRNINSR